METLWSNTCVLQIIDVLATLFGNNKPPTNKQSGNLLIEYFAYFTHSSNISMTVLECHCNIYLLPKGQQMNKLKDCLFIEADIELHWCICGLGSCIRFYIPQKAYYLLCNCHSSSCRCCCVMRRCVKLAPDKTGVGATCGVIHRKVGVMRRVGVFQYMRMSACLNRNLPQCYFISFTIFK